MDRNGLPSPSIKLWRSSAAGLEAEGEPKGQQAVVRVLWRELTKRPAFIQATAPASPALSPFCLCSLAYLLFTSPVRFAVYLTQRRLVEPDLSSA
jgi:hypothetical protein